MSEKLGKVNSVRSLPVVVNSPSDLNVTKMLENDRETTLCGLFFNLL